MPADRPANTTTSSRAAFADCPAHAMPSASIEQMTIATSAIRASIRAGTSWCLTAYMNVNWARKLT